MLKVILVFLPIVGFQIVGAGYFQAIGKATQSIFLSLSRQVLFLIPALLILPDFFELDGVIASGPAADLFSAVVTGICLFFGIKKLIHDQKTVKVPELAS
jgi:Na+-driven multidrug efflux pump